MVKNQKGFAAVPALLILVIVAIIGGTGYYVWKAADNSNKNLSNTDNSKNEAVKLDNSGIVPVGWKLYTDKNYSFSFAYPTSWNIQVQSFKSGEKNAFWRVYEVDAVGSKTPGADGPAPSYNVAVLVRSLAAATKDYTGTPPTGKVTITNIKKGNYRGVKITTAIHQTDPDGDFKDSTYLFAVKGKVYAFTISEKDTFNPGVVKDNQKFLNSFKLL